MFRICLEGLLKVWVIFRICSEGLLKSVVNVSRKVSFMRQQNSSSMDLNNSLGNTIRHSTTQNKRRRGEQPESSFTIQFHFNFNINFHENMMLTSGGAGRCEEKLVMLKH